MIPYGVPYGYCRCGCGRKTEISPHTDTSRGLLKNEPRPYLPHHSNRKSRVEFIEDPETGCWIWQLSTDSNGYGQVGGVKNRKGAHRAYYEELVGPIPEGLYIDHLCRTPACCNPGHLEPVTPAENQRRGSNAKLTIEDARAIRGDDLRDQNATQLAERFGVSDTTIRLIRLGRAWKDETNEDKEMSL